MGDNKSNKGYTLIEMIIVIAIMAILSGMAFYTYGIVKKAKCNAAVDTFNNQLTSLWIKTKALSQGKLQTDPMSSDDNSIYPLCMKIEKNTDSDDDIRDNSFVLYLGYDTGAGFSEKEMLTSFPDFVDIEYAPPTGANAHALKTDETFIIEFDKSDGSVIYGNGTYKFVYNGSEYGSIVLNGVTGNHYKK